MVQYAGLFAPDGKPLAGNLLKLTPDSKVDGSAQEFAFPTGTGGDKQIVRATAPRSHGDVVVVGRNIDQAVEISSFMLEYCRTNIP
jgi:hypothetical protein